MPQPPRVLIVDDDAAIRQMLVGHFDLQGYVTLEASDGAAALECLAGAPPVDLVITDVAMPVMDGVALIAAYRQRPGPHAPIIVMAASPEGIALAQTQHPAAALSKPFLVDELLALSESLLSHSPDSHAP